jgi:tetratricopeptide (TPR) repeat protein
MLRCFKAWIITTATLLTMVALLGSQDADELFQRGEFARAAEAYSRMIQLGHENPDILYRLGICHLQLGNHPTAGKYLKDAAVMDPKNPETWFNLGVAFFRIAAFSDAAEAFSRASTLNPNAAEPLKMLGRTYVVLQRNAEAERAFVSAMMLDQKDPQSPYLLGRLYQSVDRLEEASRYLQKSVELDPQNPRAYAFLGTVNYGLGRLKDVETYFENAISLTERSGSGDYIPYLEYGIFLQRSGKLEKSIQVLKKAASLSPNDGESAYELGKSYYRIRNYPESRHALQEAIRLNPSDSRFHYLIARVCYESSDQECGDRHSRLAAALNQTGENPN